MRADDLKTMLFVWVVSNISQVDISSENLKPQEMKDHCHKMLYSMLSLV